MCQSVATDDFKKGESDLSCIVADLDNIRVGDIALGSSKQAPDRRLVGLDGLQCFAEQVIQCHGQFR